MSSFFNNGLLPIVSSILNNFRLLEKSDFLTKEVIEAHIGRYVIDKVINPNISINANYGKFLKENEAGLGIKEVEKQVNIEDVFGDASTCSRWAFIDTENKGLKKRIEEKLNPNFQIEPAFPKKNMLIELTNRCNHRCVFCANSKTTRKRGDIDESFLKRILKEAHNEGVEEVGFYTTGEPFMSKNLDQYVRWAKEIGYKYVYLTTNGALAIPERVKPVLDAGLDSIKFSINAGSRETYQLIHGRDDFELVLDNLRFVSEYRRQNDLAFNIFVSYIVTKFTNNEKEDLKELLNDLVDEIIFVNVANQGGLMFEINDLLLVKNEPAYERKLPCPLLFNSINITYEGYLTACCVDFQNYLVVADLNKVSLREAWYCETFKMLRERHLTNSIENTLCYSCIYNSNEPIEPLCKEHANIINQETFLKDDEIRDRVLKYEIIKVNECND